VPAQTVARWSLSINNAEGKEVRRLEGDLRPPEKIVWDAKNAIGEPVVDGMYAYHFQVNYKNGKTWENDGDLKLALPDHDRKEVIDMSLQLNGARETELTAKTKEDAAAEKAMSATPISAPVETPAKQDNSSVGTQPEAAPAEATQPAEAQPEVTEPTK
jgi:hypothetical protein